MIIFSLNWIRGLTKAFVNQRELAYKSDIPSGTDTYTRSEIDSKLNGKANTSHNHSASQITSGTLPLTRGGTGVTSISALKSALGISSTTGVRLVGGSYTGTSGTHNTQTKIINVGGRALYLILYNESYPSTNGPCIVFRRNDNTGICIEVYDGNSMYVDATFTSTSVTLSGRTINYTDHEYTWTALLY